MTIKKEYSDKIVEISDSIDDSITRLGFVTYNETLLAQLKINLMNQILNLNNQKQTLIKQISLEYGEGQVDPVTWEFYPKEEPKEV